GVELPLRAIFDAPTVAALAARLEHDDAAGGLDVPPIARAPRDRSLPLTYSQEMVWFLGQLAPENLAYNTQFQLRLTGKLDVDGLRRALTELVRRHESLRTTFPAVGGRPVQQIAEPFDVELELVDLAALEPAARERVADELRARLAADPFDVTRLPL